MGKGRNKQPPVTWVSVMWGVLATLGIYLSGGAFLAFLLVQGSIPLTATFPTLAVLCVLAALAGGMLCAQRMPHKAMASALFCGVGMMMTMVLVGSCWHGVGWTKETMLLLLCALCGSLLAGVLGNQKQHKKRNGRRRM